MKNQPIINEVYEANLEINEAIEKDPRVDGENIIGSVDGIFFVPDGMSRNKRFYSKPFWESVLKKPDVTNRLEKSLMFGALGHSEGPINETDLAEGKASHFMSDLWISENNEGMGKAYILNTPAGRNLRTYLKAGCKLHTSSRARGSFKENVKKDGYPVLDESTYELLTFDFVLDPGFLETNPTLLEQLEIEDENLGEIHMEKLVEELRADKQSLKDEVKSVQVASEKLQADLTMANNKLAKFEEIGQPEEIQAAMESAKAKLESVINFIADENNADSGETESEEIKKLQEELEAYKALGTIEEVQSTFEKTSNVISKYEELGSFLNVKEALERSKDLLESYASIGSPIMIESFISEAEEVKVAQEATKLEESIADLSKKYKQPVESVKKLLESMDEAKAEEILSSMKPALVKSESKETVNEGFAKYKTSTVSRIFESYNVK